MIGNVEVDGQSDGDFKLSVAYDATIEGTAALGVHALTVRSPDLSSSVELGNYALEARFSTSADQVSISEARLKHQGKSLVAGQGSIRKPYEPNPHVAVGIAGLTILWRDVLASIRALKRVPPELEAMTRQVKSGRVEVAKASIDTPLQALEDMSFESILSKLSVNATLREFSFSRAGGNQVAGR